MDTEKDSLLSLLEGSHELYSSVYASLHSWENRIVADLIRNNFSKTALYKDTFVGGDESGNVPSKPSSAEFSSNWKVWHQKPDKWRQEVFYPATGVSECQIVTGRYHFSEHSLYGTSKATATKGRFAPEFEIAYLFDPRNIDQQLEELTFTDVSRCRFAGRAAIKIVAQPEEEWSYPPDPLMWGADDYELIIDDERGIILRLASRLRGEPFDIMEATSVVFDEVFSEDLFKLEPRGGRFDHEDHLT